jgi:hypothetical protein
VNALRQAECGHPIAQSRLVGSCTLAGNATQFAPGSSLGNYLVAIQAGDLLEHINLSLDIETIARHGNLPAILILRSSDDLETIAGEELRDPLPTELKAEQAVDPTEAEVHRSRLERLGIQVERSAEQTGTGGLSE